MDIPLFVIRTKMSYSRNNEPQKIYGKNVRDSDVGIARGKQNRKEWMLVIPSKGFQNNGHEILELKR